MYKHLTLAALLLAWPAEAGELAAMQGGSVDLGPYHGVVYFLNDGNKARVVATLATVDGRPIRFIATLAENEHLYISSPGNVGMPERFVDISHSAGKLSLGDVGAAPEVTVSSRH